jgi:hypothetical protein
LDFEKAFDLIEHKVVLEILTKKGFSPTWVTWISDILNSGTSQVLLNGVPGKPFKCKRGVRQGDPLSHLLFVMAADLLQSIINRAYHFDIIKHPLGKDFGLDYPIVQYADDTLIVLPTDAWQLMVVKGLLRSFSDSTGLKVNYSKSFLVPINILDDRALHLARTMGSQVAEMPFTYLGLPLGTKRPTVEDFLPLLNRIEKRMMRMNRLLSYQGRLTLVNSVLSSLPTYFMCAFKVPISIWDQVDKYRKHCLWDRGDVNKRGLSIIDLRAQNTALLLKFLHKLYNRVDLPWVQLTWEAFYTRPIPLHHRKCVGSFWWRDIMSLSDHFFMMVACTAQEGNTLYF